MKRETILLIFLMIAMGMNYFQFTIKNSHEEIVKTLQDSITSHYRPYKIGYMQSMSAINYVDSLFNTGLIINLTDCSAEEIKRRMTLIN